MVKSMKDHVFDYLIVASSIVYALTLLSWYYLGGSTSTDNVYSVAGWFSVVFLIIALVATPFMVKEKIELLEKQISQLMESIAIEDITPLGTIVAMRPVILKLKIRNPLDTFGLRLRFRSYDYINPSSLDIPLEPGKTTTEEIIFVPSGSGRREFSVSIARLYDENNNFIPDHEADDLALQKFSVDVEEPVAGGLSSRERSILSALIKFAAFFSASGLVYLSILNFSGMESLFFILTQVVPLITVLQVPVLMLLFYLDKKLPEKPSFIFEEG